MKILGLDPGVLNFGYAKVFVSTDKLELLDFGTLSPPRSYSYSEKLFWLYQNLTKLVEDFKPDFLACEEYLPRVNPESSAKVAQAQAIVHLASASFKIPLRTFHPSTWRSLLIGSTNGSIEALKERLKLFVSEETLDKLDEHALSALGISLSIALDMGLI